MRRRRYTVFDFGWVSWTSSDLKRITKEILQLKKKHYEKILSVPSGERTFDNTIYALETSDDSLSDTLGYIGILKEASTKASIRKTAGDVMEFLQRELVEIEFNPHLYEAVKEYAKKKEKLIEADKILFEDTLKGYQRMGFDLPKAKQEKLKKNLKLIAKLELEFDRNLNEYHDYILVTEQELDGLPETYKSGLKKEKGKYKITLAYPDLHPFLEGAHNEERRRELFEKNIRKGGQGNLKLLERMMKLRAENAKLLGYPTHADLQTELRMAKSAQNVEKFLDNLAKRTKTQASKDMDMLTKDKRCRTGDKKAVVGMHDVSYLFKQLRKERFDIDSDLVKEYFPFEHVKKSTLDIYQKLFGIKFRKRTDIPLWHSDVQFYDIYGASGEYLASFGLDLYPRKGKFGHAAAFEVVFGRQEGDMYRAPLIVMLTNFTKSTKANPSLMSHREVETFFHEFGHVMHFTLTKAKYRSQAGFNVAWDFVEAPSQILENWTWDSEMLTRISKHYKTGRSLPKDLIDRMINARLFGEAWDIRRQVVLARIDMILYTSGAKRPRDVYAELVHDMLGITLPKKQLFLSGFAHISSGYDAGYYSYLWSRVYAEDMFTRFAKEGILNPKTGHDYRKWILEKGSSMKEMDLVKGFLGRVPNNKAFLKSIGILK